MNRAHSASTSDASAAGGAVAAASSATLQRGTVAVLLGGTAVLYVSQGLTHTVVPLRLAVGTSAGLVTATYFVGFAAGAFLGAPILRRVGHIRAFGALTAVVVMMVLALPLVPATGAWLVLRTVHGAALAGLALIVESWLTATTSSSARGRVLALYTTAVYVGFGIGPLLLSIFDYASWEVFSIGALLLAGAGIPILLARIEAPVIPDPTPASPRRLLGVSSLSLVVGASAGASGAVLTALAPLYGLELGLDGAGVGILMSVMVLGGLGLQWPIGHLSDHRDRRTVIALVCAAASMLALALLIAGSLSYLLTSLVLTALQGTILTLYPLALAYANDRVGPGVDTADIAGALLLAYGAGSVLGPLAGGMLSMGLGAKAAFLTSAVLLGLAAIHAGRSVWLETATPVERQAPYAVVPHSTPEVFQLEAATVPDEAFEEQLRNAAADHGESHAD